LRAFGRSEKELSGGGMLIAEHLTHIFGAAQIIRIYPKKCPNSCQFGSIFFEAAALAQVVLVPEVVRGHWIKVTKAI